MHPDTKAYNKQRTKEEEKICEKLAITLNQNLPKAQNKIWHRHPVWFLDGNPVAGYGKLKAGIRLMFWSGADFDEPDLQPGSGKFKDASILYTQADQINAEDLQRWIEKSIAIQWDYKNIVKRKGKLERLL